MKNAILKFTYSFVVRWFLKLIVGVNFDNSDFLKTTNQFIIVANHNSHLDTMTLLASLPSSVLPRVKPVAAKDHFGKTKLSTWLSNTFINTLLIHRKRDKANPENDPIHNMVSAIDEGYSLILFPEGTRGEPEKEQTLKAGIGLILQQRPDIQIVPAYMKGMGKVMPKGDSLIIPFNSKLVYGKPRRIIFESIADILDQIENDFKELKTIANT